MGRSDGGVVPARMAAFIRRLKPGPRTSPAKLASKGRDVLWRARCNAFRRALSEHDLTDAEALKVLSVLGERPPGGCELADLANLTNLTCNVLDRAAPLMGLQNFIIVEERATPRRWTPTVWVTLTQSGLRYYREESR